MSEPLTRTERDALLERIRELDRALYPGEDRQEPVGERRARLKENYYQLFVEYGDRLPRVVMSACPFTGAPLRRAWDPWGLDGPWWFKTRIFRIEEPVAPPTFRVLLGALALGERLPVESRDEVTPGPEIPFVVPRLLELPGMVAVISRLDLATGDVAYPIGYFSEEDIPDHRLHQPWLRQDLWFKNKSGGTSWLIANDPWDFELAPWIERGKLRWIRTGDAESRVVGPESGACPYLELEGERAPQAISGGERELLEPPDGTQVDPFTDP